MENLDYHFLRYIGVDREGQRRIHTFYVPFFEGCHRVLELGCGEGYFLELLEEAGAKAVGVDRDTECIRSAVARGLNVFCQDVFDYLKKATEGEFDGIFCSHLVEHLGYHEVLELLSLCHAALAPGGVLVLATPNVRSLFSHLEMFYMHFGHVTFYHPNLLSFFLHQTGFSSPVSGENPNLVSLLLGKYRPHEIKLEWEDGRGIGARKWLRRIRSSMARVIAGPYLEDLADQSNLNLRRLDAMISAIDGSFECFVKATRPPGKDG